MYIHREIQTDQEIFEMYNALSKDSLIKMLIECNKQLEQPLRAISIDCETNGSNDYTIGVDYATEDSKDITITSWIDGTGCRELRAIPDELFENISSDNFKTTFSQCDSIDFTPKELYGGIPESTYLRQFDGLKPVPEEPFDDKYLNWLNGRIVKLNTERDSEIDLSRKINIGGKLCAYNQCLNYYKTHLK